MTGPAGSSSIPKDAEQEPVPELKDELNRFREEWKNEVKIKQAPPKDAKHDLDTVVEHVEAEVTQATSPKAGRRKESFVSPSSPSRKRGFSVSSNASLTGATDVKITSPSKTISRPVLSEQAVLNLTESQKKALNLYKRAAIAESEGDLDKAVRLYRDSFRLHDNVASLYHRSMLAESKPISHPGTSSHSHARKVSTGTTTTLEPPLDTVVAAAWKPTATSFTLSHILSSIAEEWPPKLDFQPEDERMPVPINNLPDELLIAILAQLASRNDVTGIERFAMVNRKARLVSLDSGVWKDLVTRTYVWPQVPQEEDPLDMLRLDYGYDCRHMYMQQPRVRMDGVYIAVCHYVRSGYSENAWVNMSHLVTYHRYLRFLADGTVISLLTNDEAPPSSIVSQLKPTVRLKGCSIGTWYLEGNTVFIKDLLDPGGKLLKYSFEMTLQLRSKPTGKWNRLDLEDYRSVNLETLEAEPFLLKHERPFWFSKVRSYPTV